MELVEVPDAPVAVRRGISVPHMEPTRLLEILRENFNERFVDHNRSESEIEAFFNHDAAILTVTDVLKTGLPNQGEIKRCITIVRTHLGRVKKISTDEEVWKEVGISLISAVKERLDKQDELLGELIKAGFNDIQIDAFFSVQRPLFTLNKILNHGLPSPEDIARWAKLPKDIDTLRTILHPLLCGWTVQEVIDGMRPYIRKNVSRYKTAKNDEFDCSQQAALGVMDAIRTDAGISPFAEHGHQHVRTKVRRSSTQAGVIKESEKRPSKTDVRREITTWLAGRTVQNRAHTLARGYKRPETRRLDQGVYFEFVDEIGNKVLMSALNKEATAYVEKLKTRAVLNEVNRLKPDDLEYSDVQVIGFSINMMSRKHGWYSISNENRSDKSPVNTAVLKRKPALLVPGMSYGINHIEYMVDEARYHFSGFYVSTPREGVILMENETGEKVEIPLLSIVKVKIRGREMLIKNSIIITKYGWDTACDLLEWLTRRFTNPQDDKKISLITPNQFLQTVADVVKEYATNPDFQGNPMGLDMQVDSEGTSLTAAISGTNLSLVNKSGDEFQSTIEIAATNETRSMISEVIRILPTTMKLTSRQKEVLEQYYGLNGVKQISGTEIAEKLGITRQRVTQYIETDTIRLKEALFQHIFMRDGALNKRMMEETIRGLKMSFEDRMVLSFHFGLYGVKEHDVNYLADHYEDLTGVEQRIDASLEDPVEESVQVWSPEGAAEAIAHLKEVAAKVQPHVPIPPNWGVPIRRTYVKEKLLELKAQLILGQLG